MAKEADSQFWGIGPQNAHVDHHAHMHMIPGDFGGVSWYGQVKYKPGASRFLVCDHIRARPWDHTGSLGQTLGLLKSYSRTLTSSRLMTTDD